MTELGRELIEGKVIELDYGEFINKDIVNCKVWFFAEEGRRR